MEAGAGKRAGLEFSVDAHLSRAGAPVAGVGDVVQGLVGGANLVKVGEQDVPDELDLASLGVLEAEHSGTVQ